MEQTASTIHQQQQRHLRRAIYVRAGVYPRPCVANCVSAAAHAHRREGHISISRREMGRTALSAVLLSVSLCVPAVSIFGSPFKFSLRFVCDGEADPSVMRSDAHCLARRTAMGGAYYERNCIGRPHQASPLEAVRFLAA